MIIVIIAGGSGTRLWPLSQPNFPKHLLRLTGKRSLLQNTYHRARRLTDQIYVVTEASHADEVKLQLPLLKARQVIVEPARRGTASCIILALARLKNLHHDEAIAFLHTDHHIDDHKGFARAVREASRAAKLNNKIVLIGLKPSYPATGFGYIKVGDELMKSRGLSIKRTEKFVEKPDFETAKKYLSEGGYLWNLGLFVAQLIVFEANMRQFAPDLYRGYQSLQGAKTKLGYKSAYLRLKNQAIDTALIERTDQILVVPGEFDWADIGSFFDLHRILQSAGETNVQAGEVHILDCEDSMIHASTKPIIAIGLNGIVVVDTPAGLLVCSKEQSQKVGELSKKLLPKPKLTDRKLS